MTQGWMPCLAGIVSAGASGTLRGFAPFDPEMSWTTIATGRPPDEHFSDPPTFWEWLQHRGRRCAVIGWPGAGDLIADGFRAAAAGVRITPKQVDPKLLGLFLPRLAELPAQDHRPRRLLEHLARLYSGHNASMVAARDSELDLLAVTHVFLDQVIADFLPFQSDPIFSGVVTGAYRLMDALLADLIRRLGQDATVFVVSDHGFAAAPVGRRAYGLFAARGAPFVAQTDIRGSRLADLFALILTAAGEVPPPLTPAPPLDPAAVPTGAAHAIAVALVELARLADAVAWFHRCQLAEPESVAIAQPLARCLLSLNLIDEAIMAAAPLFDLGEDHPACRLIRAEIGLQRNQGAKALEILAGLPDQSGREPSALKRRALLSAGRFSEAKAAFTAALAAEPDEPLLHVGLGYALLGLSDLAGARAAAAAALALDAGQSAAQALLHAIPAEASPSAPKPPASPPLSWDEMSVQAAQRAPVRAGIRERNRLAQAARQHKWLPQEPEVTSTGGSAATEARVRPVWPDELDRVKRLLPLTADPAEFSRTGFWAIAAIRPERLVGAAALHERRDSELRQPASPRFLLDLAIKPAWGQSHHADDLLATVLAAARQRPLAQVEITLDPSSALAAKLVERGFTPGEIHEAWKVVPQQAFGKLGPVVLRGLLRRQPAAIAPLCAADLDGVRALCSHYGLLSGDRVALQPEAPSGFDPRFSFVLKRNGQVVAALLCRRLGAAVYLEVGARYAAGSDTDSNAVVDLTYTLLDACIRHGVAEIICLVRPAATPKLVKLLKRARGQCIKRGALFIWKG